MRNFNVMLEISWDDQAWDLESDYLVSAGGTFQFRAPGDFIASGGGSLDQADIVLANVADRYLPYLANQYFYQKHVRLYVSTTVNGVATDMLKIFTGAINSARLNTPTGSAGSMLTLSCTSEEGPFLQRKYDLLQSRFKQFADSNITEADWIDVLLEGTPLTRPNPKDEGLINIPWLWADDESILEECWAVAAACGGIFYSDLDGWATYKNASSLAKDVTVPVETFARTGTAGTYTPYSSATLDLNQDELYSDVVVEVSTRHIDEEDLLWEPEEYERLVVPAGGGKLTVIATYDDPVYQINNFEYEITTEMGTPFDIGAPTMVHYAQKSEITFTNSHAYYPALIRYFRVTGVPVTGRTAFEFKASSILPYWTDVIPSSGGQLRRQRRTRSVRGNNYVQTQMQGQFLADLILAESEAPRPIISLNGVPGKQTRFIGDVVEVVDTRLGVNFKGRILSLSWTLGTTYEHSLTIQSFGTVYANAPYFVLNSTDQIGPSSKKMYY